MRLITLSCPTTSVHVAGRNISASGAIASPLFRACLAVLCGLLRRVTRKERPLYMREVSRPGNAGGFEPDPPGVASGSMRYLAWSSNEGQALRGYAPRRSIRRDRGGMNLKKFARACPD